MADAISKFLSKVSKEEKALLIKIITSISKNELTGLNAKKLVGHNDVFRIRKGNFRIIYKRTKSNYIIIAIDRRSEKTYRDF